MKMTDLKLVNNRKKTCHQQLQQCNGVDKIQEKLMTHDNHGQMCRTGKCKTLLYECTGVYNAGHDHDSTSQANGKHDTVRQTAGKCKMAYTIDVVITISSNHVHM